jgi:hypothetical protein
MARGISRYDEAAFQGRLWSPADKSIGINAWFDAGDLSTITYGTSGVSQWNDKSGNGFNATQATDSLRPVLKFNAYNNLSVLNFNNNPWMQTSLSASSTTETIFAVISVTGSATRTILGSDSDGGRQFRLAGGTDQLQFIRQAQLNLAESGTGNTVNKDRLTLVILEYDSTTSQFYSDGGNLGGATTVSPSLVAGKTTRISQGAGGLEFFIGDIAEIIVYQAVAAKYMRQRIEGYLSWKWGFSHLLKTDHPFVSRPPLIGDR